jgi:uncharacterized damage-inducible protein DinB
MDIDQIRDLYDYHYALHRKLWGCIDYLTDEQFTQPIPYSIGAVRNHMIHLASVDQRWIARVAGTPLPDRLSYDDYPTQAAARARWDEVEVRVLDVVMNQITDADLARVIEYPIHRAVTPDRTFTATSAVWQILVHIVNHGTDHRAQVLRLLHDFGAPTLEQDMMIYWWE